MVPAASSAVVVIVRGLGKNSFREIIYYHPDNVDRATLEDLICKVEECGAFVQSLEFDMGNTHLQGHSVYNNTDHFLRSQVENLFIKVQKSISYDIESSIYII